MAARSSGDGPSERSGLSSGWTGPTIDRRAALRLFAGGAAVAGLSACGGVAGSSTATSGASAGSVSGAAGKSIKIGYVTPQSGPLAAFGEADAFVVNSLSQILSSGITIGGKVTPVEVIVKDSQSDPKLAADAATDLILNQNVDLMLVASTPDTVNPVSDQCEANGTPCISSVAPWEAFFFGRGGKSDSPFKWTYHFFWGLNDILDVYQDIWTQVGAGKNVGALWPNDSDGAAWSDPKTGLPTIAAKGYNIVDGGKYPNGTSDFTAQLNIFKKGNADILVGVPIPPDFTTFWKQAAQQGYRPKVATIAKAILFPSAVEALGPIAENLSSEVWWSPSHPYSSSLTKQTAAALAGQYTTDTGKQWTQPIGMVHALFEVAVSALQKAGGAGDKAALAAAIGSTKISTVAGPLDWTKGPVANVATTPLVGGQWRKGTKHPFEMVIVSNTKHPEIPAASTAKVLSNA